MRLLGVGKVLGRRRRGLVFGVWVFVLLVAVFGAVLNVPLVKGDDGTIYIRADGTIDPPTAPISTLDNVTYTLTDNITSSGDGIIVERDDIIIEGDGYTLQGSGVYSKGIDLTARSNVTIKNTRIMAFHRGIYLYSSSGNSISGNNITNNSYGIELLSSSNNNSVIGNNITANWHGIKLSNSSNNNTVYGNNITANNEFGIWLDSYSNNNSISGNNIANHMYGIGVYSLSSDNEFYHNNIINNTYGVYFYLSSTNAWDDGYASGGNYWSDYAGVDEKSGPNQDQPGSDGIGDTPYIIDANNRDRYPLMNPWPSGPGLHELEVGLKAPKRLPPGSSTLLEATVTNKGFNDEENVTLILFINSTVVNSTIISLLEADSFSTISYSWTPTVEGWFNVTAYAIPVTGEIYVANNLEITFVRIHAAVIIRVPHDYLTIQAALNAAEEEDTVFVYNGTYYENVVVRRAVSLIGENREITIIDGGGKTVVSVVADNVVITNFTVQNGTSAIYLSDSHNVSIYNNRLNNNWVAIWVYYSDIISIRKNTLTNSGLAICLDHSNGNLVTENNMMGSGITLSSSAHNNISRNNIDGGERGIGLFFVSAYNIMSENNITNHVEGVGYQFSYWNKFYHNNFVNNFWQVYDYGFNYDNYWDDGYPSGGNYWSDYSGIDEKSGPNQDQPGSDGIGDTGGPVGDRYPLMNPWAAPFPVARFAHKPNYAVVNRTVTFNASASYDSDGTIETYTWGFGDGNTTITTDPIITHVYTAEGIYQVNLTITDNEGLSRSITKSITVGVDYAPPITVHDYDNLWHTLDFTITLTATEDVSGVAETYYKINNETTKTVNADGQPFMTTEGANNMLEYWSVDNANNEELPHNFLTTIKLDKTAPSIDIPSREPSGDVQPDQSVKVSANVADFISQVKNVTLHYTINDGATWTSQPMNPNPSTNLYEATIPSQEAGTWVRFKIVAYDNAGNEATLDGTEPYCKYPVIPEFPSAIILPLFIALTILTTILTKTNINRQRRSRQQGHWLKFSL